MTFHRQALSTTAPVRERAAGAVVGALVGDALGVGPHWFYDLEEMRKTYGRWITEYTDPEPNRYHAGLKAGQFSQAGLILLTGFAPLWRTTAMSKRISVGAWTKNSFPSLTARRIVGQAVIRANRFEMPGANECWKRNHGRRPVAMPIRPKRRSALSSWRPDMQKARPRWPRRFDSACPSVPDSQ